MECPVCYKTISNTSCIRLECGHGLCRLCATAWVCEKKTCPLCRQSSLYFSRNTRSRSRAVEVLTNFRTCLEMALVFPLDPQNELDLTSHLLERYVLDQKSLWYRPDMKTFSKELCTLSNQFLNDPAVVQQMGPHNLTIFRRLIDLLGPSL